MSTEDQQAQDSLSESIVKNINPGIGDSPDVTEPDVTEPEIGLEPEFEPEIDDIPLDPPNKWDRRYKEVFEEWGKHPNGRQWQETILDYYKENQGYATQLEQDRARYRQQAESWGQVIQPYEQMIAMAGTTPDNFVRQAMGLAMQLQQNPRDTLLQLAQRANIDLNQLVQEQPYVDPQVQNLQTQMQRLQETYRQREQRQAQEQVQRIQSEIDQQLHSFAQAKADNGDPKFPHFSIPEVQEEMAAFIRGRPDLSLEDAYARACREVPEVSQAEERQKRLKDAAARAAKAKKEADAARRVPGKYPGDEPVSEGSLQADILKNLRKSQAA